MGKLFYENEESCLAWFKPICASAYSSGSHKVTLTQDQITDRLLYLADKACAEKEGWSQSVFVRALQKYQASGYDFSVIFDENFWSAIEKRQDQLALKRGLYQVGVFPVEHTAYKQLLEVTKKHSTADSRILEMHLKRLLPVIPSLSHEEKILMFCLILRNFPRIEQCVNVAQVLYRVTVGAAYTKEGELPEFLSSFGKKLSEQFMVIDHCLLRDGCARNTKITPLVENFQKLMTLTWFVSVVSDPSTAFRDNKIILSRSHILGLVLRACIKWGRHSEALKRFIAYGRSNHEFNLKAILDGAFLEECKRQPLGNGFLLSYMKKYDPAHTTGHLPVSVDFCGLD